jgi:hypothetical protein
MKKLIVLSFSVVTLTGVCQSSKAQSNWELGARFGEFVSIEATVPIGAAPRLHPAIYVDDFGIGTYFDWMFVLNDGPQGLKFYPGVGPEFFFEGDFNANIVGNFGTEYSFDFPLTIGFDWRPGFRLTNDFDFITSNWGFTARFRFGEGTGFRRAN